VGAFGFWLIHEMGFFDASTGVPFVLHKLIVGSLESSGVSCPAGTCVVLHPLTIPCPHPDKCKPEREEFTGESFNVMELDSAATHSVAVAQGLGDESMIRAFEAEFGALKQQLSMKEEGSIGYQELNSLCKTLAGKIRSLAKLPPDDHGPSSDLVGERAAPGVLAGSVQRPSRKDVVPPGSDMGFSELATQWVSVDPSWQRDH
jgi:hypothetical protein